MVAVTKEHLQVPEYKLARSSGDGGGQSGSTCPAEAFSGGATSLPAQWQQRRLIASRRVAVHSEAARPTGAGAGGQPGPGEKRRLARAPPGAAGAGG